MNNDNDQNLPCFGRLDSVFPMQPDGLRHSPPECLECPHKTECLRTALQSCDGLALHEEKVDRAYGSGRMGFFERWAKKKAIDKQRKTQK
ncbi:MAG: hypothetical protein SWH68_04100 [Thermodesulfobacteriota bacterium]|nr:hypothetical protein [Thermodesulfobacteriota bacterium]